MNSLEIVHSCVKDTVIIINRADIKFDNLFSNLEHRLNDEKFKEIELKDDNDYTNIELSI